MAYAYKRNDKIMLTSSSQSFSNLSHLSLSNMLAFRTDNTPLHQGNNSTITLNYLILNYFNPLGFLIIIISSHTRNFILHSSEALSTQPVGVLSITTAFQHSSRNSTVQIN